MLDIERQIKYGSSYSVTFPDYPSFTSIPKLVKLRQEIGSHDVLSLTFQHFSIFVASSFKTGTPVVFTWGNDKVQKTFVGYVSHIKYPTAQILNRTIEVTCVGASYPLKDTITKVWTNMTASQVVTEIANMVNLTPKVTPSTTKFSQISMAGHSLWEKLTELADRIGWGVQVIGTELHFHPIDVMIDTFMNTIPVMAFINPFLNEYSHVATQTLDSFESKLGDFVESSTTKRTSKTVSGVDPVTGTVYTATSYPHTVGSPIRSTVKAPLFGKVESAVVANSDAMTKALADGKAHLSRLAIPGKGIGQGDPRISPWGTVEVRYTGDNSDGFWIVKSAVHTMYLDGRYMVEFECATDGTGANQPSATRPSTAGTVPTVNLNSPITGINPPNSYTLTAATALIDQTNTGFNIVPRRWVGA